MKYRIHDNKELQFAFSCIHDFFDNYSMSETLRMIDALLKAGSSGKPWNQGPASDILYFSDMFLTLFKAIYSIDPLLVHDEDFIIEEIEPSKNYDSLKNSKFISSGHFANAWNCFPRHLTLKELADPIKVLRKFTAIYAQLDVEKIIKEITFYALSNDSIDDEYSVYEVLRLRKHFLKLTEACHLLHVRNTIHKQK